jgi:hypothetical protein
MSAVTDLIVQQTDPVVAIILIVMVAYMAGIRRDLKNELSLLRERIERVENELLDNSQGDD